MGATRWSDADHKDRATVRAAKGIDAFEHDADVRAGRASGIHDKMNPHGVKIRESRDSDAHPDSHAVAVLFDVTGSMQTVPRILQENLPKLMGLLIRKDYLPHPAIMVGAIGDATCDSVPLQMGQFESGIEIEEDLGKLVLEGGGGGHITESYELAMYFMARHTSIDCFEKRNKKGYLFIIGDETPYENVKKSEIKEVLGESVQENIPTSFLVSELKQKWEVYYILPKMTNHYDSKQILGTWQKLLGQNAMRLEDPTAICELIASTIGLAEGKVDTDDVTDDLKEFGTKPSLIKAVNTALAKVDAGDGKMSTRKKGSDISVPDSGKESGIATL
jgi:hypothetical protein